MNQSTEGFVLENYCIEVWLGGKKAANYIGHPEDILSGTDLDLVDWYTQMAATRKWALFCEVFDSRKCRSGTISHLSGTIRISHRKHNDNV